MARLWRDQGKRNQARNHLAPIYGWFSTSEFDPTRTSAGKYMLDRSIALRASSLPLHCASPDTNLTYRKASIRIDKYAF
jgi:hypothetical protein